MSGFYRQPNASIPRGFVLVNTTSTQVFAETPDSIDRTVQNVSDTDVFIALGATASLDEGVMLEANGGWFSTDHYTGVISAIHRGTGTKRLLITEV